MYGLLKKPKGKRGGPKRGRAHPQKLVDGLGRVFRRNLALLRKRVKFVNPARAREKKEKNHAPLPRLDERPRVPTFVAPATDADVIAALRAFGVPNYTLGLPGDPAGRLRLLRGLARGDSVRSWRISEQMSKQNGKLRDFVLEKNATRDDTVCAWCQGTDPRDQDAPLGFCSVGCATTLLLVAKTQYKYQAIIGRDKDETGVLHCSAGRHSKCFGVLYKGAPWKKECTFEVDHKARVCDGNGACGLDNLRALCPWCHRGPGK